MSINSQAYGGRPGCSYGGACGGYGCPISAKASTLAIQIPRALATGKLDLRSEARVTEIAVGPNGKVSGVHYLDAQGREQEVKAKQVILAAGAIGSPHLLQMSQSGSFPDGLANSSGQVGRNLTYHHFPLVIYTLDQPTFNFTGIEALVASDDLHPSDASRGFIRGGVITDGNPFIKQPLGYSLGALNGHPNLQRNWGSKLKQALRDFPRSAQLTAILEDLPMETNRVELDPDLKDKDGLPAPRITHKQHPNDLTMFKWFEKKMLDIAGQAGAINSWAPSSSYRLVDESSAMQGSVHIHGTCRMGDDPSKSVLDRWCRSHDVKNLWVVDGSFFPTAGGYNPTLTLMANAYRVADHFISEGKKGNI
jgi:choline dehydrogenase-like flavoprotein